MRGYSAVPINLTQDFGEWLDKLDFDTWATLTFAGRHMTKDAYKARVKFEKWLYNEFYGATRPISHMVAVEKFHQTDYTHIHALIRGLGDITYDEIGESWRKRYGGINQIEKYEQDKGANFYITKYTTKEMMDWNIQIHKKHRNQELEPSWVRDSARAIINDKR